MQLITAFQFTELSTYDTMSQLYTIENSRLPAMLSFASFLYLIGLLGMIYNYKNYLVTMMSVELMYLGVILSFVLDAVITHNGLGYLYALLIIILAACESAIGLGILIILYRFSRQIDFSAFMYLGG